MSVNHGQSSAISSGTVKETDTKETQLVTQTLKDEGEASSQTPILHSPYRADVAYCAKLLQFGLHYRCHCVKWVMYSTVLLY